MEVQVVENLFEDIGERSKALPVTPSGRLHYTHPLPA